MLRASLGFSVIFVVLGAVACGGTDPTWIGAGSPKGRAQNDPKEGDAGPDAPKYRDPNAGDGACTSPNLVCGASCTDVSADRDHCGACDKACLGNDSICNAGNCACMGTLRDYCDGVGCMDVSEDTSNCGACGKVCDPNQFNRCVQGNCVLVDE